MRVLFVTWDGPQVSYLESLFLPIFARLANEGITFQVLQFTWGDAQRIASIQRACELGGVGYEAVPVWRRPRAVGAMLTALAGARHVKKAIQAHQIDLVLARSTLPALAAMLALRNSQCPMVFDADGLPLDERVDFAGQAPSSLVHRMLRDVEAEAVRRASVVLTRSSKAIEILHARAGAGTQAAKFHVVGNGRDADRFHPADASASAKVRASLGLGKDTPLMVYAGSMGSQYCMDEMLQLFAKVHTRRPDAHLLILTGSPEAVQPTLGKFPLHGCVTTLSAPAQAVAQYLGCADLGLALRQPSFSMQAVAPIKLGEYLLCGLPVVATAGIGDTSSIVNEDIGFIVDDVNSNVQLDAAANWFVDVVLPARNAFRDRCRGVGVASFSLEKTLEGYRHAFNHVFDERSEK
jgi:glycosyltransferase involved in cell wall biosynthesis